MVQGAKMPAGGLSVSAPSGVEFEAKITPIVVISCIMAATGGLMFGYDVGVSGTANASSSSVPHVYRSSPC